MSRFILHVGVQKTGSTTLQKSVFANHPQLCYLGKHVRTKHAPKECRSRQEFDALSPLLWPAMVSPEYRDGRATKQLMDKLSVENERIVGSWEALGSIKAERFAKLVRRMREMTPNPGLIICLRNPVDWVPSLYLQSLQAHFAKRTRFYQHPTDVYRSIDQWIEFKLEGKSFAHWIQHTQNINHAVSILGRENVCVLQFEQLREDPSAYYNRIAEFLDIDPSETLRLGQSMHANTRLTQSGFNRMQKVFDSPVRRGLWRMGLIQPRRRWLYWFRKLNPSTTPRPGTKIKLAQHWQQQINTDLAANYAELEKDLKLNLRQYRYPH